MPIHPARKDKEATADMVAALILVAWAELRNTRDIDKGVLTELWKEIKEHVEEPQP